MTEIWRLNDFHYLELLEFIVLFNLTVFTPDFASSDQKSPNFMQIEHILYG